MKRRALRIFVPLCLVFLAGTLCFLWRLSAPRLQVLGFTSASSSNATAVLLSLRNSTTHPIYLNGPSPRSTFYSREVATPAGWTPADLSAPVKTNFCWPLNRYERFVFAVPAMSNQQAKWRVTVRYFDGGVFSQIPVSIEGIGAELVYFDGRP
jgi:hypothetical protein